MVSASPVLPGRGQGRVTVLGSRTDDTGAFRIFGLTPGEYLVRAQPPMTPSEMPALLPAGRTGPRPIRRRGYVPTYFPGTGSSSEAQRIRVNSGEVHGPLELTLQRVQLLRITGILLDPLGEAVPHVSVQLKRDSGNPTDIVGNGQQSASTRFDGSFEMTGIPPGDYAISAYRFGGGTREFAWTRVTVADDLDGLVVNLRRAVSVRGRLMYEGASRPPDAGLQIKTVGGFTAAANSFSVQAERDGSFTLDGLFGPTLIRVDAPKGWHLGGVFHGHRDITDEATEFAADGADLRIVLTDLAATLRGTVRTPARQPTDGAVVVFSQDQDRWDTQLTTTRVAYAGADGAYQVDGLRPGPYFAAAVPREDAEPIGASAEYFQFLTGRATPFVVQDAEPIVLNLTYLPAQAY